MNKRGLLARGACGVAGATLLVGVAGAAVADVVHDDEVEVNVEITDVEPARALTMSVASASTTLTEVASEDPELREFDGDLPVVTVTDDREDVPADQFWYVTGQSSAFTAEGVDAQIGADHLGWRPRVVSENNGEVAPGDEVVTVLDDPTLDGAPNNVGLVGEELLALALDSSEAAVQGEWKADAELFLKTPNDVAPGSYSATLTLTLWEDAY